MSAIVRAIAAPLAYSVTGAADALGLSVSTIGELIRDGSLIVRYSRSKRVIPASELLKYLDSLPFSRP